MIFKGGVPGTQTDIEQRLARLESVIKLEADGSVTIECRGKVKIRSAASVEIEGGMSVLVRGGATVEVAAAATLTLKGAALARLDGGLVKLNQGSRPLARLGDTVSTPSGTGVVQGGNSTVFA